jgi:hypothetical protein
MTPTVQLNALAMKLNLPPVYTTMVPAPAGHRLAQPFGHNHPTNGYGTPNERDSTNRFYFY